MEFTLTDDQDLERAALRWLIEMEQTLAGNNLCRFRQLLTTDCSWRDLLVTQWDLRSHRGAEIVADHFVRGLTVAGAGHFRLLEVIPRDLAPGEPRQVDVFLTFDTNVGSATAYVNLSEDAAHGEPTLRAQALVTRLDALKGVSEHTREDRPVGTVHRFEPGRSHWKERRLNECRYDDRDPDVVVIGAGHNGLGLAARLGQLGLSALVLERGHCVGDNWRSRYPSLVLHDPVEVNHLPYMPFPDTWPRFLPKDKLADWLEYYAQAMELNVWTDTEVRSVRYDSETAQWQVELVSDGQARVVGCKHVVFATGLKGKPRSLDLPGADEFAGTLMHSSEFPGAKTLGAKKAVVVGAGVSAHDIAQDLCEHGSDVTMIQRSSTYVVSIDVWRSLTAPKVRTSDLDKLDMVASATPLGNVPLKHKQLTEVAAQRDAALHSRLRDRGFALDFGPNGLGMLAKHLSGAEGYYINVGASELIADGTIDLRQGRGVSHLESDAVVLEDGEQLPADLVVMATGYDTINTCARELLGDDVAARLPPIYSVGPDGEMVGVWRPTGMRGLWFTVGAFSVARPQSKLLALQIKARELGLVEDEGSQRLASKGRLIENETV